MGAAESVPENRPSESRKSRRETLNEELPVEMLTLAACPPRPPRCQSRPWAGSLPGCARGRAGSWVEVVEPGTSWHLPARSSAGSGSRQLRPPWAIFFIFQGPWVLDSTNTNISWGMCRLKSIPYLPEIHISWGNTYSSGHCLWASLSSFLKWWW